MFKKGDRVRTVFYNQLRTGTVWKDQQTDIVWVLLDGKRGPQFFHSSSLTPEAA